MLQSQLKYGINWSAVYPDWVTVWGFPEASIIINWTSYVVGFDEIFIIVPFETKLFVEYLA